MKTLETITDIEAERSVLMLLMKKPELFVEINGRITADDFYEYPHKLIYTSLNEMYENNEPVDLGTLAQHLTHKNEIERVGGITTITDIFNAFGLPNAFSKHIDTIREMSVRRTLAKTLLDGSDRMYDLTADLQEVTNAIVDSFLIVQEKKSTEFMDIQESLPEAFESLFGEEGLGLLTNIFGLDMYTRGLRSGNLVILAGRPAMGKTALALNILANVCKQGKSVMLASLEMSRKEIEKRLIYTQAKISENEVLAQNSYDKMTENGGFTDEQKRSRNILSLQFWDKLNMACEVLHKWKLSISQASDLSISKLKYEAKARKKKKGLDLIIIDYLQLMSADVFRDNRVAQVSYITRQLKLLAQELEIPIILLSQLNRGVEGRNNKRPVLSDLRESGSIEQDADKVLMLYRDSYYNDPADPWTELIVAKNRNGGVGTAKLDFHPEYTLFSDWNENQPSGKEVKVF